MGNPHKGDVSFAAAGETYTLRFSVDALCELEEATGKTIVVLASDLGDASKVSMGLLRKVIWAGLRDHHPGVDLKAAGELILAAGGVSAVMAHVGKAFALAFPEPEGDAGGDQNPPKPGRNGTGPASSETGAA